MILQMLQTMFHWLLSNLLQIGGVGGILALFTFIITAVTGTSFGRFRVLTKRYSQALNINRDEGEIDDDAKSTLEKAMKNDVVMRSFANRECIGRRSARMNWPLLFMRMLTTERTS